MERRPRLQQPVRRREHVGERGRVQEGPVAHRVQVREVDHGPHPGQTGGDREDVLGCAELADASHHLDPEGHRAPLPLEPRTELGQVAADSVDRGRVIAAEQEPGVHDHELGAAGGGEPGRVVEHADGAAELRAAVRVPGEGGERRVDRERDVARPRALAEGLREVTLHPEPGPEVELAGAVAGLHEQAHGLLGRVAAGKPGRADTNHGAIVGAGSSTGPWREAPS